MREEKLFKLIFETMGLDFDKEHFDVMEEYSKTKTYKDFMSDMEESLSILLQSFEAFRMLLISKHMMSMFFQPDKPSTMISLVEKVADILNTNASLKSLYEAIQGVNENG